MLMIPLSLILAISNVQSFELQSQKHTNAATLLPDDPFQHNGHINDRDTQILALDLKMEGRPSDLMDLFVWGPDLRVTSCQPITSLQLVEHSPFESQVTDDDIDADVGAGTPSKSFVPLTLITGNGTFSFSFLELEPAGFDPRSLPPRP